ncbi:MAG TPA: DUF4382 domain-containing protein [Gemmatimonadaceae bacterium]
MTFRPLLAVVLAAGALLSCSDGSLEPGEGRISLRMTDAPFPLDQVESIEMFVVRVEARPQPISEEEAALDVEEAEAESDGWIVIAEPNDGFDLMELRNGVTVFLGDEDVPVGAYHSIRLILDTDRSSVTLKDGTVLTGVSTPSIKFPSAGKSGIKVLFTTPIVVDDGETVDVLLDFDAEESFVLRGNTIMQNGLLFKPVIRASIE